MADREFDFYVYSDGSGTGENLKPGAFAATILSIKHPELSCASVVGGNSGMGTMRAELTAMLEGIQRIYEYFERDHRTPSPKSKNKPTVLIVSDRDDLVGMLNHIYKISKNGDLWARMSWYAERFDIEAKWVKRETNIMHSQADRLASGFRLVVKEYVQCQESVNHIART